MPSAIFNKYTPKFPDDYNDYIIFSTILIQGYINLTTSSCILYMFLKLDKISRTTQGPNKSTLCMQTCNEQYAPLLRLIIICLTFGAKFHLRCHGSEIWFEGFFYNDTASKVVLHKSCQFKNFRYLKLRFRHSL